MHKCICCQDDLVSFIHPLPKKSQDTNHPFSHFFQVWVQWMISTQSYCNALIYRRRDSCWKDWNPFSWFSVHCTLCRITKSLYEQPSILFVNLGAGEGTLLIGTQYPLLPSCDPVFFFQTASCHPLVCHETNLGGQDWHFLMEWHSLE